MATPRKPPSRSAPWTTCASPTPTTARNGPADGLWGRITNPRKPGKRYKTIPNQNASTKKPSPIGHPNPTISSGRNYRPQNCPKRTLPTAIRAVQTAEPPSSNTAASIPGNATTCPAISNRNAPTAPQSIPAMTSQKRTISQASMQTTDMATSTPRATSTSFPPPITATSAAPITLASTHSQTASALATSTKNARANSASCSCATPQKNSTSPQSPNSAMDPQKA